MKKSVFIVCILLFWVVPAFAMKNSPDGFRGIKWGDPVSALGNKQNIRFEGQADGFDIYTRTTDKLAFGDVPLEFIIYFFCNDKFVLVGIDCKDEYADMIMRIFKTRFGVPTQPNKYLDEYEWKDGNALITMKHDKFNKIVSISMSSREQYNIAMHFLDECSKTAQSDF